MPTRSLSDENHLGITIAEIYLILIIIILYDRLAEKEYKIDR